MCFKLPINGSYRNAGLIGMLVMSARPPRSSFLAGGWVPMGVQQALLSVVYKYRTGTLLRVGPFRLVATNAFGPLVLCDLTTIQAVRVLPHLSLGAIDGAHYSSPHTIARSPDEAWRTRAISERASILPRRPHRLAQQVVRVGAWPGAVLHRSPLVQIGEVHIPFLVDTHPMDTIG